MNNIELRRNARECVFKLVFASGFDGDNDEVQSMALEGVDAYDEEYFRAAFDGITTSKERLREIIKKYALSYDFERLYKVDLAILMVAVYEIVYMDDIPYKVSANEAVELAKKYSTEKSASYINGILGSVIKHREELK